MPPPRSSLLIRNSDFLPDQIKISLLHQGQSPQSPRRTQCRGSHQALHDPVQPGQCTTAHGGCGGGEGNPSCGDSRGSGPFRLQAEQPAGCMTLIRGRNLRQTKYWNSQTKAQLTSQSEGELPNLIAENNLLQLAET